MSLDQFNTERTVTGTDSNRKPLNRADNSDSLLESEDTGSQFGPKFLILGSHAVASLHWTNSSQYMTDCHANIAEVLLKDSSITFR